MRRSLAAVLAWVVVVAGPRPARADYYYSTTSWYNVTGYGYTIAGRDLNGPTLNAGSIDGKRVESVSFSGATWDLAPLVSVWLDGSNLEGIDGNGRHLVEGGMAGATFNAVLEDGSSAPLFVAAADRNPDSSRQDVWGYRVWYPTATGWQPFCGSYDDGGARYAIALAGRWDYRQGVPGGGAKIDDSESFTFACDGSVLAKCVLAGYEPWRRVLQCAHGEGCTETTLASHHQACTRALRADYFGDGTPHTHEGMTINIFDDWGVRAASPGAWAPEAEWNEQGALCVARSRVADEAIQPFLAQSCGGFESGALLVTELPQ